MKTARKPVDPASVIDLNSRELEPSYRRAIAAALPAGLEPSDEFWAELADAVAGYFILSENRTRRQSARELERFRKIVVLIDELGKELRAVRSDQTALSLRAEVSGRALTALWPVRDYAAAYIEGHRSMNPAFRGRGNPHREFLYGAVLDLWQRQGQRVRYSRAETNAGMPRGPLIRFFVACVGPILGGDTPKPSGIATILDRAKDAVSRRQK